jgi:hypothetical protein
VFQFPDAISTEGFLDRYWQKGLLFMPQALPGELPELSADELGWLATLDDVESRLVFTELKDDATHYRVDTGLSKQNCLPRYRPKTGHSLSRMWKSICLNSENSFRKRHSFLTGVLMT